MRAQTIDDDEIDLTRLRRHGPVAWRAVAGGVPQPGRCAYPWRVRAAGSAADGCWGRRRPW